MHPPLIDRTLNGTDASGKSHLWEQRDLVQFKPNGDDTFFNFWSDDVEDGFCYCNHTYGMLDLWRTLCDNNVSGYELCDEFDGRTAYSSSSQTMSHPGSLLDVQDGYV
ncbi:hypothetical protein V6N13_014119 [Hibiscus sabdariffa]